MQDGRSADSREAGAPPSPPASVSAVSPAAHPTAARRSAPRVPLPAMVLATLHARAAWPRQRERKAMGGPDER